MPRRQSQQTRAKSVDSARPTQVQGSREPSAASGPSTAVCAAPLATHVDSFVNHTTFVPLLVPASQKYPPGQLKAEAWLRYGIDKPSLAQAVQRRVERERLSLSGRTPSFEEFSKGIVIDATVRAKKGADELRSAVRQALSERNEDLLRNHYEWFLLQQREEMEDKLTADPASILSCRGPAEVLFKLGQLFREEHHLFKSRVGKRTRETQEPLLAIPELGYLFLERLRVRPIGYTPERAPFYELSLEPGEVVTLRQRSFSKRSSTLEQAVEETKEQRLEYSSTFTTEVAEEYATAHQESNNWGVNANLGGNFGSTDMGIQAGLSGQYGASSADSTSASESSRRAEEAARKVESSQKISHKTVLTVAAEDVLEEESVRVIRNDEPGLKKIFMRRLMQVLHLSYERYGVRMCWAPCIQDPGRDVRAVVPGPCGFPEEMAAIEAKWVNMPAPAELGPPPQPTEAHSGWQEHGAGPFWADGDEAVYVRIPSGYEYESAYVDFDNDHTSGSPSCHIFRSGYTCPHGKQYNEPAVGSQDTVKIWVHYGVNAGNERLKYRVIVKARPTNLQAYYDAVNRWRSEQAEAEKRTYLDAKKEEMKGMAPEVWQHSELMRRILDEYFRINQYSCELVEALHRVFEWEHMSAKLYPPCWSESQEVTGLQSLQTTFFNASWAKVFVPIRPGSEELALSFLLAIAAIPNYPGWLPDLEAALREMRGALEPQYREAYEPSACDAADIAAPQDLQLTPLGQEEWRSDYEKPAGFRVLRRFAVTIPTDGVDFEESSALCPVKIPSAAARERAETAKAGLAAAVARRVEANEGSIEVKVSGPSD